MRHARLSEFGVSGEAAAMQLYLSVYTVIKQTHRAYCHSLWNWTSSDTNFCKQRESRGAKKLLASKLVEKVVRARDYATFALARRLLCRRCSPRNVLGYDYAAWLIILSYILYAWLCLLRCEWQSIRVVWLWNRSKLH